MRDRFSLNRYCYPLYLFVWKQIPRDCITWHRSQLVSGRTGFKQTFQLLLKFQPAYSIVWPCTLLFIDFFKVLYFWKTYSKLKVQNQLGVQWVTEESDHRKLRGLPSLLSPPRTDSACFAQTLCRGTVEGQAPSVLHLEVKRSAGGNPV